MPNLVTHLITIPRDTEVTPESAATFLSSFPRMLHHSLIGKYIHGTPKPIVSLEVGVWDQQIRFLVTCSSHMAQFVTSQIQSTYPLAVITPIEDPLLKHIDKLRVGEMKLALASFYPIRTWADFRETDPMSSYLSVLSKATKDEVTFVQMVLAPPPHNWQRKGQEAIDRGRQSPNAQARPGQSSPRTQVPEARAIQEKITNEGFSV